jgi:glycerophosphoryl diester phosphodiesterase
VLGLITGKAADLEIAITHRLQWFNVHFSQADEALMRRAHEAGLKVTIWTLDDPQQWGHFAALGVDSVCTNVPHLMPV